MRLSILGSLIVWAGVSAASGQEVVREFSWSALKKAGQLTVGEIEPGGPAGQHEQLKIDNPTDEPKTVTLLDLKNPGVTTFNMPSREAFATRTSKGRATWRCGIGLPTAACIFHARWAIGTAAIFGRLFRLASIFAAVLQQREGRVAQANRRQCGFRRPRDRVSESR